MSDEKPKLAEVIDTTYVGAQVPTSLVVELDRIRNKFDRSRSAEVRQAIRAYVDAEPKEKAS